MKINEHDSRVKLSKKHDTVKSTSEFNFKITSYRIISEANSNKKLQYPDEYSDKK